MTTYTVDTDGTSGDYSNLNAALADLPSPLDDDYTIECSASTDVEDTTAVDQSPSLGSYDLHITRGDTNYKLSVANSKVFQLDVSGGGDVYIEDMYIESSSTNAAFQHVLYLQYGDTDPGAYYLLRNIIKGADNDSETQALISYQEYWGGTLYIVNNFILDAGQRSTSDGITFNTSNPSNAYIYNNTIVNCYTAISGTDDDITILAVNNLFYDCDVVIEGVNFDEDCDYNSTDSATATGGENDRTEQTFSFVGSGDYHLEDDDTGALNHGTDLSSDANYAFDDDIDGDTRSGTWDIGADEYVSGGTTHSVSVSDGIVFSDSTSGSLTIPVSVVDGMTFGDSAGGALDIPVTITDGIVLTDSIAAAFTFRVTLADGIILSDQATEGGVISVTISDGVVFGDSASASLTMIESISDGVEFGDSASGSLTIRASISDGVSFSDAISTAFRYLVSISDGITLSDVVVDSSVLASGKVSVTISAKTASVTITAKKPTITITAKQPEVSFDAN